MNAPQQVETRPLKYIGGWAAVATLAVLAGVVAGVILTSPIGVMMGLSPLVYLGLVPLIWFLTFVALLKMLKGVDVSGRSLFVYALGLSVPAFVLYVPVCSVSSLFTTPILGSHGSGPDGYGPKASGVIIGSAVAFLVILLSFAFVVRRRFPVPTPRDVTRPSAAGHD